jgi:hypothetical protein
MRRLLGEPLEHLTMKSPAPVEIALRIPGTWSPRELVQRLPPGYRLTP